MIELLAQEPVTHDRSELYAVIGALVLVIGVLWAKTQRQEKIIFKLASAVREPERDDESEGA